MKHKSPKLCAVRKLALLLSLGGVLSIGCEREAASVPSTSQSRIRIALDNLTSKIKGEGASRELDLPDYPLTYRGASTYIMLQMKQMIKKTAFLYRDVQLSRSLKGLVECDAVERRRFYLSGGYLNIGNYVTSERASACLHKVLSQSPEDSKYYRQKGALILEASTTLSAERREKAMAGFDSVLSELTIYETEDEARVRKTEAD